MENNLPENSATSEENPEDTDQEIELNVSDEEISLNLGKYSAQEKLALVGIGFMPTSKNLLQSRENPGIVLGAFSARNKIRRPVEIKSATFGEILFQKSNRLFNLLINRIVSLI